MADREALGLIEVRGLANSLLAADAALKAADIVLEGVEPTKGSGLMLLRLRGSVSGVRSAIGAAKTALESRNVPVFATHVIPRLAGESPTGKTNQR